MEYIEFGKVIKPHGIKGNLAVECFFEEPQAFINLLFIEENEIFSQISTTIEGTLKCDRIILQINNISSIEDAKKFINKTLFIHKNSLPNLPKGEFYTFEVIGLKFCTNTTQIGTITDIVNFGSGINFEITTLEEKLEYYVYNDNVLIDIPNQQILLKNEKS